MRMRADIVRIVSHASHPYRGSASTRMRKPNSGMAGERRTANRTGLSLRMGTCSTPGVEHVGAAMEMVVMGVPCLVGVSEIEFRTRWRILRSVCVVRSENVGALFLLCERLPWVVPPIGLVVSPEHRLPR